MPATRHRYVRYRKRTGQVENWAAVEEAPSAPGDPDVFAWSAADPTIPSADGSELPHIYEPGTNAVRQAQSSELPALRDGVIEDDRLLHRKEVKRVLDTSPMRVQLQLMQFMQDQIDALRESAGDPRLPLDAIRKIAEQWIDAGQFDVPPGSNP